jgi:hypothetical protein
MSCAAAPSFEIAETRWPGTALYVAIQLTGIRHPTVEDTAESAGLTTFIRTPDVEVTLPSATA